MEITKKNNNLFESKHYYLKLLQSIENIKRKAEYQFLSTDTGSKQLEEVKRAWIEAFLGLIEEGIDFIYIKCPENSQRDIIRITIENINYDCLLTDLIHIMKNRLCTNQQLKEIIREEERKVSSVQMHKTHTTADPIENLAGPSSEPSIEVNDRQSMFFTKKEQHEEVNQSDAIKDIIFPESHFELKAEQEIEENEDVLKETKVCIKEERAKEHNTFVYDELKIEIYEMGATIGEKFHLWIMPINISEDDLHARIMVAVANNKGEMRYFASEKIATVIADLWGYEILVRGMFKKGVFESYVILAGNAAASNCNMNKQLIEHRCEEKKQEYWGHIFFEEKGKKIHAIPFEKKDAKKETEPAGLIVTIEENDKYYVFANPFVDEVIAPLEKEVMHISGYWMDDKLIVDAF